MYNNYYINDKINFSSKECLPYLQKSNHAHILNLSPPLNLSKVWFAQHVAYTMAKYGMSMCVLGMAEEFKDKGVAVNALWPQTAIHTAAIEMLTGPESATFSRKPDIMADAAYNILCRDPKTSSGNFFIDEEVVKAAGVTDLKQYACVPENADNLMPDFFLDLTPEQMAKWAPKIDEKTAPAAKGKIDGLFTKIESMLSEELVKRTNASFLFKVTGAEAGFWHLDLKSGSGKCGKGEGSSPSDATLTMDSKNFFDMFSGKYLIA